MLGMSLSILLIIIYLCSKIHTFCPYILSDSSFKCYFALYEFLTLISFNNFKSKTVTRANRLESPWTRDTHNDCQAFDSGTATATTN